MHNNSVGYLQGKNLSFFQQKSLRVRRLYDSKRNTVVYIAYSTRLTSAGDEGGASTGRYKYAFTSTSTSLCAHPQKPVVYLLQDAIPTCNLQYFFYQVTAAKFNNMCRTSACAVPVPPVVS